jgi:hypothetical protein
MSPATVALREDVLASDPDAIKEATECAECYEAGRPVYRFASQAAYRAHLTSGFIDGMQLCQDPARLFRRDGTPTLTLDRWQRWVRTRGDLDDARERLRALLAVGWKAARSVRECAGCTKPLAAGARSDARYCSARCRQRVARARRSGAGA